MKAILMHILSLRYNRYRKINKFDLMEPPIKDLLTGVIEGHLQFIMEQTGQAPPTNEMKAKAAQMAQQDSQMFQQQQAQGGAPGAPQHHHRHKEDYNGTSPMHKALEHRKDDANLMENNDIHELRT